MNKVILMGRLTRDPDVRYSQGDSPMAIARYTLAVDRRFRRDNDQQTADFISCVASASNNEGGFQPQAQSAPTAPAGDGFMNIPDGVEDVGLPFNF